MVDRTGEAQDCNESPWKNKHFYFVVIDSYEIFFVNLSN